MVFRERLRRRDPMMRFGRRVQAIDRVGGERDGGVEVEAG
jgi:hypothetical protein